MIDRSGMAWCISAWGREEMLQIAIEEWAGASPIYTRRMQTALKYEGVDIFTIFKGLQLDIGAPPQFMDFRYTVHDRWHGEFHLDHCGALLDVEPMGPDYVKGMCHDIEDPTFDATAVATNPRAQVRPIHRPPRVPAGRTPHCAWTVIIDAGGRHCPSPNAAAAVAIDRRRPQRQLPLSARSPIRGPARLLRARSSPISGSPTSVALGHPGPAIAEEVCAPGPAAARCRASCRSRPDADVVGRDRHPHPPPVGRAWAGVVAGRLRDGPRVWVTGPGRRWPPCCDSHPAFLPGDTSGCVVERDGGVRRTGASPSPAASGAVEPTGPRGRPARRRPHRRGRSTPSSGAWTPRLRCAARQRRPVRPG